MADNTTMGSTTDVIRDKDRAGVKSQIFGIDLGIGTGTENLMAGSMPVTLPVPGTALVQTVNTSGTANTNATLLAADSTRDAVMLYNAGTGIVSFGFTTATSSTVFTHKLNPGDYYEVPQPFATFAITAQATVVTNPVNVTTAV